MNRMLWFSESLRNASPSSVSAANTTTTESVRRTAAPTIRLSDRPSPLRSRTSATPQRSAASSSPAAASPRRTARASSAATSSPMSSSARAPTNPGRNPPS